MALEGFAQGALAGFGAVNKFYDDKRRRDLDQRQIDNLKAYRDETLEAARLDRGLKREQLEADTKRNQRLDSIADINARAGLLRARTAETEQDRVMGSLSERGETPGEEQSRLLNEARTRAAQLENQATDQNQSRVTQALQVQDIYNLATQPSTLTPDDRDRLYGLIADNSKTSGMFNIGNLTSQAMRDSDVKINGVFEQLANMDPNNPQAITLDRGQINAFSRALGLDDPKYIGRQVDSSFVNAPNWIKVDDATGKDRNAVVTGATLYQPELKPNGADPTIGGMMAVITRDSDGQVGLYFPDLTDARDPSSGDALDLTLGEVSQVVAGGAYTRQALNQNPMFQRYTDDALIQLKYGDNKGDTGQEEYSQIVQRELEEIMKAAEADADRDPFGYVQQGEDLKDLAYNQQEVLRQRIADKYLRGISPVSTGELVEEFLQQNSAAMAEFELPFKTSTNLSPMSRGSRPTLADIPEFSKFRTGDYSPQKVARMARLFTAGQDGQIKLRVSEAKFKEILLDEYGINL